MRSRPMLGLILCIISVLSACQTPPDWVWEKAEAGLPRQAVTLALVADPRDPSRLWAGYYAPNGLAVSSDGGQTWTIGAQGLGDDPIFDLLLLPGDVLWAGTRDGLLRSTDGGTSWEPVAAEGLPAATAFALATDAAGQVYVGFDDAGLYLKEQDSDVWAPLARDEPLSNSAVLSLAVSPDGNHLYAGTAGHGLYASQDAGRTWKAALPGEYVPNLAVASFDPLMAVASLRNRLVRTRDGGVSWEPLPVGWARDEAVSLIWLASPSPQTRSGETMSGTLFAGSGRGQVYCSQDGGETWEELGVRVPTPGGVMALTTTGDRLMAGTWTGVYATSMPPTFGPPNPGPQNQAERCGEPNQTWKYLSPSLGIPNANTLLATNDRLLIGTRAGLFRWHPTTRRWERVQLGHSSNRDFRPGNVTALARASRDGQVAYAAEAGGGLYRSNNGGVDWIQVPSELEIDIRAMQISPRDAARIYVLAAWERMYESSDGGQTWQARWTGLGVTTETISLAIDPESPSTLYLGTDTGLYRSRHRGKGWRPVGHRMDDQTVLTLVARPSPNTEKGSSVLYIGATRGAYRSHDGGDTVELWGKGLEEKSVTAILFDPKNPRTVYAGTAYAGLYTSVDGGETWLPTGPPELAGELVESMAWAPTGELAVASKSSVWMGRNGIGIHSTE
jgi:photosystem II stability/assembly factor-like uncharacterized protein